MMYAVNVTKPVEKPEFAKKREKRERYLSRINELKEKTEKAKMPDYKRQDSGGIKAISPQRSEEFDPDELPDGSCISPHRVIVGVAEEAENALVPNNDADYETIKEVEVCIA